MIQFIRAKISDMNDSLGICGCISSLSNKIESQNNQEKFCNVDLDYHNDKYAIFKAELLGRPIRHVYAAMQVQFGLTASLVEELRDWKHPSSMWHWL